MEKTLNKNEQMRTSKYHYEYEVRCDNLCWGGLFIGRARTQSHARYLGENANKGCYSIRRIRVYNEMKGTAK